LGVAGVLIAGVPLGADRDLTAEARIRRAALELFAARGYDGTTTRAIAARAEVSPGLVLHHFGTKERLRDRVDQDVVATVDELFARMAPVGGGVEYEVWLTGFRRLFEDQPDVTAYLRRGLLEQSATVRGLFDKVIDFADGFHRAFVEAGVARTPSDHRATVAVLAGMSLTAVLLGPQVERYLGPGQPIETRLARATLELMRHGTFEH
jgi:TetR/AcrR family transcriptional regulator, regulator of cefoperazone and chloramphenicol sensitivity